MATVKLTLSGQNALAFVRALEQETNAKEQGWWLNYISCDMFSAQFMAAVDGSDTSHIIHLKADGTWVLEAALKLET